MTAIFITLFFALFSCCRCESNFSYDYYPTFHLGPLISSETEVGWMNDPNGFSYYKGFYHLFYQYNPKSSLEPGIAHWGHATSRDLVNWNQLPIALYPDTPYDIDGVFSGSALVENYTMYLFYTGNINHPGKIPDHEQHQLLATTTDGLTFTKYDKPIIYGEEHQPNFRDPKVWKDGDTYYMVLGNSFKNDTLGRVLLYSSKDILNWKEVSVLAESDGSLGYMWECPDLFELDGHHILMFSPQGVEPQGYKYLNLYQVGYIVGSFNKETGSFIVKYGFKELDHGHDFYATQSMIDKQGRRVVIAWMDMWEQNYPEGQDGFTGQMTLARTLKLTCDGLLLQQPIPEIKKAVGRLLYSGKACTKVTLENNTGRIEIHAPKEKDFTLVIESESGNGTVKLSYNHKKGLMTFDRGGKDGVRRTKYTPVTDQFKTVIYIDKSSFEAFIDRGEVTFSSRIFLTGLLSVRLEKSSNNQFLKVNAMMRTVSSPTLQIGNAKINNLCKQSTR